MNAQQSLETIAQVYKNKLTGPYYEKMKNKPMKKKWTRFELGLEDEKGNPDKAPLL